MMDYFKKYSENPFEDLRWNIPEQKMGTVAIAGGNAQSFRTPIKVAEWLGANYPIETIRVILPDVLKTKMPPLPNLVFLSSTESGSLADSKEMAEVLNAADYSILIGDLSRNAVTARAIEGVCRKLSKPVLITRDAVDLLTLEIKDSTLMNEKLTFMASLAQLQKLFRTIYYPKILTLNQSLPQVVEILHKFTLSYPVKILTLLNGQILVTKDGEVAAVPLEKTSYSPLTLWSGEAAAKIAAYNLYNPGNFTGSTICAVFQG